MSSIARKFGFRGVAALILGAMAFATPVSSARAGGFFDFFNAFGDRPAARPLPQPDVGYDDAPDLVVRPKPRRHRSLPGAAGSQRYNTADLKGVTIYNDRTLVPGDAVMTTSGLKVFDGSRGTTHAADDFVAVAETSGLAKGVRSQLIAIDAASRPGLAR